MFYVACHVVITFISVCLPVSLMSAVFVIKKCLCHMLNRAKCLYHTKKWRPNELCTVALNKHSFIQDLKFRCFAERVLCENWC